MTHLLTLGLTETETEPATAAAAIAPRAAARFNG